MDGHHPTMAVCLQESAVEAICLRAIATPTVILMVRCNRFQSVRPTGWAKRRSVVSCAGHTPEQAGEAGKSAGKAF